MIVFLTESFLDRNWSEAELEAALNRENSSGQTVVLPLMISDAQSIFGFYPLLRDKLYLEWEEGPSAIADYLKTLLSVSGRSVWGTTRAGVASSPKLNPEYCRSTAAAFGTAVVVIRRGEKEIRCEVYGPDGDSAENTRSSMQSVIDSLSHLSTEVTWIEHRYAEKAKGLYRKAGEQVRDAIFSPHGIEILERSNQVHFVLDYPFLDIPWELCAGSSGLLGKAVPVSRSAIGELSVEAGTQKNGIGAYSIDSLRILVIDTTGNELGIDSATHNVEYTIAQLKDSVAQFHLTRTPRLFELQTVLAEMRPNLIWIVGHQMEDSIPLSLWGRGIQDHLSAEWLAQATANQSTGLLLLDCCKTGGLRLSSEQAFPNIMQKSSDWSVIHPFGWTGMADSERFTRAVLSSLSAGASLLHAVFNARQRITGWWSLLLQGRLSSLCSFRLNTNVESSLGHQSGP